MKYPRLTLHPHKTASLERQHPWVFSGAISKVEGKLADGDIVELYSSRGQYLATAHYQSAGSISARVLTFEQTDIDFDFWVNKITDAYALRRALGINTKPETNAYRLVNAEGDGIPGLIADFYNGTLVIQAHNGGIYRCLPDIVQSFQQVLGKELPETVKILNERLGIDIPGSRVMYYRGEEGLSQVNWNVIRAKGQLLSYEVATASAYMSQTEAEKLRQEIVDHKITVRTLTNKTEMSAFTKVKQMVKEYWDIRYLPPRILDIKADIFIYNDIYAVCHYLDKGDVFCFEMQNKLLADMHRQMFENMWLQAGEMTKIGDEGKVRYQQQTQ